MSADPHVLVGELDVATEDALGRQLPSYAAEGTGDVVLDCAAVTFVDSSSVPFPLHCSVIWPPLIAAWVKRSWPTVSRAEGLFVAKPAVVSAARYNVSSSAAVSVGVV